MRHLPFLLVFFILLFSGATDLAIGAGPRVLVTLLAPLLWLGLYLLGTTPGELQDNSARKGTDVPESD